MARIGCRASSRSTTSAGTSTATPTPPTVTHTIEALVAAGRQRGYEYVAVSDHSRIGPRRAGGL